MRGFTRLVILTVGLTLALPAGARSRDDDGGQGYDKEHRRETKEWRGDGGGGHKGDGGRGGPREWQQEGRRDWRESGGRDRDRAAEHARQRSRGGRVLSAEPDGDKRYRVRVLTPDGYIRNLSVDPRDED